MARDYSRHYAEGAARYDALRLDREEEIELTGELFRQQCPPRCSVLEIGCGTGRYGARLETLGYRVTGLDLSHEQIGQARGRLKRLLVASACSIPARDASFDACLAVLMLHQVPHPDRKRVFSEVLRILRFDGSLCIKTCSPDDLATRWVEHYFPSTKPINAERYPSIDGLVEQLTSIGFRVEAIVPTRTVPSISTADLLSAVEERHNTTLRLVPAGEFAAGLARLSRDLAGKPVVEVTQAHTHVLCRKPKN